jgi:hypothetical protein
LRDKERQPTETFSAQTVAGKVEKVPVTGWKDLVPYWASIARAFFEVLIENDFKPYTATLRRPKGFVASSSYWNLSLKDPKRFPLSEARFFMYKLQEKPCFTNSIRQFNQRIQKNWLEEKNIAILGGYIYSFYYTLKPVLKVVGKGTKASIKPIIVQKP